MGQFPTPDTAETTNRTITTPATDNAGTPVATDNAGTPDATNVDAAADGDAANNNPFAGNENAGNGPLFTIPPPLPPQATRNRPIHTSPTRPATHRPDEPRQTNRETLLGMSVEERAAALEGNANQAHPGAPDTPVRGIINGENEGGGEDQRVLTVPQRTANFTNNLDPDVADMERERLDRRRERERQQQQRDEHQRDEQQQEHQPQQQEGQQQEQPQEEQQEEQQQEEQEQDIVQQDLPAATNEADLAEQEPAPANGLLQNNVVPFPDCRSPGQLRTDLPPGVQAPAIAPYAIPPQQILQNPLAQFNGVPQVRTNVPPVAADDAITTDDNTDADDTDADEPMDEPDAAEAIVTTVAVDRTPELTPEPVDQGLQIRNPAVNTPETPTTHPDEIPVDDQSPAPGLGERTPVTTGHGGDATGMTGDLRNFNVRGADATPLGHRGTDALMGDREGDGFANRPHGFHPFPAELFGGYLEGGNHNGDAAHETLNRGILGEEGDNNELPPPLYVAGDRAPDHQNGVIQQDDTNLQPGPIQQDVNQQHDAMQQDVNQPDADQPNANPLPPNDVQQATEAAAHPPHELINDATAGVQNAATQTVGTDIVVRQATPPNVDQNQPDETTANIVEIFRQTAQNIQQTSEMSITRTQGTAEVSIMRTQGTAESSIMQTQGTAESSINQFQDMAETSINRAERAAQTSIRHARSNAISLMRRSHQNHREAIDEVRESAVQNAREEIQRISAEHRQDRAELNTVLNSRFDQIDANLEAVYTRLAGFGTSLENIETAMNQLGDWATQTAPGITPEMWQTMANVASRVHTAQQESQIQELAPPAFPNSRKRPADTSASSARKKRSSDFPWPDSPYCTQVPTSIHDQLSQYQALMLTGIRNHAKTWYDAICELHEDSTDCDAAGLERGVLESLPSVMSEGRFTMLDLAFKHDYEQDIMRRKKLKEMIDQNEKKLATLNKHKSNYEWYVGTLEEGRRGDPAIGQYAAVIDSQIASCASKGEKFAKLRGELQKSKTAVDSAASSIVYSQKELGIHNPYQAPFGQSLYKNDE